MPALRAEADAEATDVEQRLAQRAEEEATALRKILETQQKKIFEVLGGDQLKLALGTTEAERENGAQLERDRKHLERRRDASARELETEPAELAALYAVKLRRFEPVGLVYLYPELRL